MKSVTPATVLKELSDFQSFVFLCKEWPHNYTNRHFWEWKVIGTIGRNQGYPTYQPQSGAWMDLQ